MVDINNVVSEAWSELWSRLILSWEGLWRFFWNFWQFFKLIRQRQTTFAMVIHHRHNTSSNNAPPPLSKKLWLIKTFFWNSAFPTVAPFSINAGHLMTQLDMCCCCCFFVLLRVGLPFRDSNVIIKRSATSEDIGLPRRYKSDRVLMVFGWRERLFSCGYTATTAHRGVSNDKFLVQCLFIIHLRT